MLQSGNSGLNRDLVESGGHARAVLEIRRYEFPGQPEVEVLALPVLIASGDNLWAFTRSSHAPLWAKATSGFPCIYGYSERFGLVVNATPLAGIARAYELAAYQSARFAAAAIGEVLWHSDKPGDTRALAGAIRAGRGLRLALTDADDVSYALSVHLAELYAESDIALYTEFDAVPSFILSETFLENFALRLAQAAVQRGSKGGSFGALGQPQRTEFASVYFRLRLNGLAEQWDVAGRAFRAARPYRRLVVVGMP